MTHFGILCPPVAGHLNPMTALGYELQQRGHQVTLFGMADAEAKTLAAGLEFQVMGQSDFPLGRMKAILSQQGKLRGFKAFQYTIQWVTEEMEMHLRELPKLVQFVGIELLLVDQASQAGGTIADYLNIPFITVCNALILNVELRIPPFYTLWNYQPSVWGLLRNQWGYILLEVIGKSFRNRINSSRQNWNLPLYKHPNDYYSSLLQLSQQPREFEFPRKALPTHFHFTGPYNTPMSREPIPFPYEKLTGQPLIYASLGTLQNRLLWVFQTIAEACMGLDVQLVIALGGGASPAALSNRPENTIVVSYAPQLELLQKAALTITHGGMNTTLESLSQGVPLVAIPIANDQLGIGARIAWTGTGEVVALGQVNAVKLRRTIQQVLTEASYQQNALRLKAAIQAAGGVRQACYLIEQTILAVKFPQLKV